MNKALSILVFTAFAVASSGTEAHYSLPQEIPAFCEKDGRLNIQLGGKLEVSTSENEAIRIPVSGDLDGKIWVRPLSVSLIGESGHESPGGFETCLVGESVAEVLVKGRFGFQVDAGAGMVPKAGRYRVRISAMATGQTGQSLTLSAETTITVQESKPLASTP